MRRLKWIAIAAFVAAVPVSILGQKDWPTYGHDLGGMRYSPLSQITPANVATLKRAWTYDTGEDASGYQVTPLVVGTVMYLSTPLQKIVALDAETGKELWKQDTATRRRGTHRGVSYWPGDGKNGPRVLFSTGDSRLLAFDAKTGKPVATFGKDGQASVILDVIQQRHPEVTAAITLGYWFTTAPQFYDGAIYIGSTRSESHIPGGHVIAVDAKSGKVRWHFNTIPQDERDQGWAIAGPTWVGGERNGGGIWETPSIDPALGRIYVAVGNPFGDSTKRIGTNLFTDSIIALTLADGHLEWHFQQTHHDLWDYDSGNQPVLFDMQVAGRPVRALAEASKNGYHYILNRETGQPVHPIKEVPVPTASTRPGEQAWPTQPIPFTARGVPMKPVSPIAATDIPPERLATRTIVPQYKSPGPNQISAPGTEGGANYGPIAYGKQTGWLYVTGVDNPLGGGRPARGYVSAFDPATGELVWQKSFDGHAQAGTVVTAGGVVFAGSGSNTAGYFYAFDAKSGDELWKFNTGAGVFGSPSVYMVNGEEFVTVPSGGGERGRRGGDLILSFALPPRP